MSSIALKNYSIIKYSNGNKHQTDDLIAIEEPLQIVLIHSGKDQEAPLTITMRSPGNDYELAIGLLYSEGIISTIDDIEHIRYCNSSNEENQKNKLKITLKPEVVVDLDHIKRNFLSNSSCGLCGKQLLSQLCEILPTQTFTRKVPIDLILKLPQILKSEQLLFKHTGGIHACALVTSNGSLLTVKEDIGRHNAFDKLIGYQLTKKESFQNTIAVLSGRIGYEMAQKAAKAGIPIIVAIGAPTSLAIDIAQQAGICLIGFVKSTSLNIYTNPDYIET
ncbi:formate dehydrogenase accessory sulfurtransferase FdhD [Aquimarina agarilytica]|uniref:formate dehydrogenase accessory sulfurtransferase FdhD n=1 Tax=Aquimarina agarilytica TaxID=1087449 RepID=UPI0002889E0E|nr:formate dehydrogenase accessory sulfurtransferase FdhD [Aquimarina agarilytica]